MPMHLIDWPDAAFRAGAARIPCGLRLRAPSGASVRRCVEMLAGGPSSPLLGFEDVEMTLDLDSQEVSIATRSIPAGGDRPRLSAAQRHVVEVGMLGAPRA